MSHVAEGSKSAPPTSRRAFLQASLTVASAIITEASLSFLGLGQRPPAPSWLSCRRACSSLPKWPSRSSIVCSSCCTRLLTTGVVPWVVQQIAGHSSEQMTQHYGHLLQDTALAAVEKLNVEPATSKPSMKKQGKK